MTKYEKIIVEKLLRDIKEQKQYNNYKYIEINILYKCLIREYYKQTYESLNLEVKDKEVKTIDGLIVIWTPTYESTGVNLY